jgi:hypothetical protein
MLRCCSPALVGLFLSFSSVAACAQASNPAQNSDATAQKSSSESTSAATASADQSSPPEAPPLAPNAPHMSRDTHYQIIRDFETQLVYARTVFPMGAKGIQLRQGVITPNGPELQQELTIWGPAIKPGDPARISFVQIKNDHIRFEINGGPVQRKKWYQHIEVAGAEGPVMTGPGNSPTNNPHGSFVDLYFAKYVPEMSPAQLRQLLYPVLDFSARNKEQAYLDAQQPKVRDAIVAHHILVGMNQEMVLHAKGKPPKKVREREGETDYEEWIYGEPPADVDFVRFVADEVVRVETMKVNGEKIVRTQKEITLPNSEEEKEAQKQEQPERPSNAPSLRRPGESSEDVPQPASAPAPPPALPPPDLPQPNGPNQSVVAR